MCSSNAIELQRSMYHRARRFYITRPWGMNIDSLTLSALFEKVGPEASNQSPVLVNSRVTLLDLQENEVCEFKIVNPQHSEPEKGKISFLSPLGAALMKANTEDTVSIPVLGGTMRFQVLGVN